MNGLAALLSWRDDGAADTRVRDMLQRMPHRGPGRRLVHASPRAALGTVARGTRPSAGLPGLYCIADARLDNRDELLSILECPDRQAADAELLLHGYRRWGAELAAHLVGDFAFIIWDEQNQTAYAARDPFGVRTLFYRASGDMLALASEVEPLVCGQGGPQELEDRVVLDYLLNDHRHARETFFWGVFRVQPGHWLLAGPDSLREQRYWRLPRWPVRLADAREYAAEFRRLFRQAVDDRLDREAPTVAQLSGGLDSSSIVCMAEDLFREDDRRPALHPASAVYPGLPCDESVYVGAVARRVRFPIHRWDARTVELFDADLPAGVTHPWEECGREPSEGDQRLALQLGARGIVSGFGGDQLLFEQGVYRDLAAHGRWLTLALQTLARPYSSQGGLEFFTDAVRAAVPRPWRRAYRNWCPAPRPKPPGWLGGRLLEAWRRRDTDAGAEAPAFASNCQQATWNWLTRPQFWWSLEAQVLSAARRGLEMRFPFLDSRLARFVLAMPYEFRLPSGSMKRLLRRAMQGLLPSEVLYRKRVTTFESLVRASYPNSRARLEETFSGGTWFSSPYLEPAGVQELFAATAVAPANRPASWSAMCNLVDIAQLEVWLRGLHNRGVLQLQGAIH